MTTVVRPNHDAFKREVEAQKKELAGHYEKFNEAKTALEGHSTKGKNDPEWAALMKEFEAAKSERSEAQKKVQDKLSEIKALDQSVQKKLKTVQELRPKNGAKNEQELQAKIAQLEKLLDSGELAPVEERKIIKEATSLKNARRQFGQISKLQAEIDADKALIAEKKKGVDQSELKAAKAKVDEVNKRIDKVKAANQEQYKKSADLWQQRKAALSEIRKLKSKIDASYQDFYAQKEAFDKQEKEARKQEKLEKAKAHKLAEAEKNLAQAQIPVFEAQIQKASLLLSYFDKSHTSAASDGALNGSSDGLSVKREVRKVDELPSDAKVLSKAGPERALSRKEQKRKASTKPEASGSKLQLDVNVVEDLTELKIPVPVTTAETEQTAAALREKISFFEENNARVTEERVQRARAALEKIKLEDPEVETKSEAAAEAKSDA